MASRNAGCLIPFGLLFVIAGSIPGVMALNDLRQARAMRGWHETTARVQQVELKHGEDSVSITASYRYRAPDPAAVEGGVLRDYDGSRVGIHRGSDNVGDWQARTYARLEAAARRGTPVPCWYDPAAPSASVLDRDVRWGLVGFMFIFPLVFGLVGGGIAWLGLNRWRKARRPAEPAPTRIRADDALLWALWIGTLMWNAISWVAMCAVLTRPGVPWPVVLMVALFPLIGFCLLWTAVQKGLRRLRHGRPELRLDRGAWTTGQRVQVALLTKTGPQPGDRIEARLVVVRRVTTGSDDNRHTSDQTLWSLDVQVDPAAATSVEGVWVHRLELPLPSDMPPMDDAVSWRLEWQLIRPGPDLCASFTLPIAAGSGQDGLKAAEVAQASDRAAPLAVLLKAGVSLGEERGEVVIALPAWRNPGLHLAGLIATAVLSVAALGLGHGVGWWTAVLTGPLVLLCWRGALRSALWRSTITLGRGRISASAGWWRLRTHELAAADVAAVERTSHMSSGDVSWFNMWLKTRAGERIAIIRGVPGPAAARIAEMIEAVAKPSA